MYPSTSTTTAGTVNRAARAVRRGVPLVGGVPLRWCRPGWLRIIAQVRATRMAALAVAAVALATTAVAAIVVTHDDTGIDLGPVGIEVETPTLPTEAVDTGDDPTDAAGETPAPAAPSDAPATSEGPASSDTPATPPSTEPVDEPIETVTPAPANPVPAEPTTGRPESPGNSNEHNPNK